MMTAVCFDFGISVTAHFTGDDPDALYLNVRNEHGELSRKLIWHAQHEINPQRAVMALLAQSIENFNNKTLPPVIALAVAA